MISYFRLWRLLEKRGYSRWDIIWLAGISDSTYQKLVHSDHVRMDVLERICKALNVDIGDICSFRRLHKTPKTVAASGFWDFKAAYLLSSLQLFCQPTYCFHFSHNYKYFM